MYGLDPFYRTYTSPYSLSRAQAIAAQRAKRAQWLPDEYDDDDYGYNQLAPSERAYLDAHRQHVLMEQERRRREFETKKRANEERRWQDELDRRQEEDEVARHKLQEEKQKRRQTQNLRARSRSGSPSHRIPISNGVPSTSAEKPSFLKQPPLYDDEKHHEAASKIQRRFRIHRSLQSIKDISSQFEALRNNFVFPSIVTFYEPQPSSTLTFDIPTTSITPSDDVNIDSVSYFPKLSYNSTNYNLHAYTESLEDILIKLDGVESWGDPDVRKKRRSVVKSIEKEQGRVDRFCQDSWLKHQTLARNSNGTKQENQTPIQLIHDVNANFTITIDRIPNSR